MIGIYNRGNQRTKGTFIQNVSGCKKLHPKVCGCLSDLQSCKIAIAHISDERWKELIEDYSSPGDVRVRVTVGGNFFDESPPKKVNGVYIFHLMRQAGDLDEADWEEILDGLSHEENVKALVDGGDPNGLRRFFVHEAQDFLPALTILCKGYLAVHADDKTYHKDIGNALDLMRWTDFQNSASHTDLGDKKNEVQQPTWWLQAFERESFCDDMKKDWKATTGSDKLPDELNALLDAILNHESVVPNIIADAYCVLAKQKLRTVRSDWENRRSGFNHYWLKNQFLIVLGDFIEQLEKPKPNCSSVRSFLKHDFPDWKSQREEASWIVNSFEDSSSPRRHLSCPPLNRCDDETQAWLGDVVQGMWLSRYPEMDRLKESRDALATVDKLYEKIAHNLPPIEALGPEDVAKLKPLHTEFCKLEETFRTLKTLFEALRKLSEEV